MSSLITPVILSGGAGTRLWPLSRQSKPKQFLALDGDQNFMAMTAQRAADRGIFRTAIGDWQRSAPFYGRRILAANRHFATCFGLGTGGAQYRRPPPSSPPLFWRASNLTA